MHHCVQSLRSFYHTFSKERYYAEGEQSIGTLKSGEKVWAYNPQTQKMELQPIQHVWINHDNDLIDLTLFTPAHIDHGKSVAATTEVIHTNQKHPFLTQEAGFVPVGELLPGMHTIRADGSLGVVSKWEVVPGTKTMYNLEVAQDHTFVVGDGQWVVHNCTEPQNLIFNSGQIGKKWGKHNIDYPSMSSYTEYRARAQSIFDNPDKVLYNPDHNGGRFYYTQGEDLVIVRPDGTFESLYPGANTPVVLKGTRIR